MENAELSWLSGLFDGEGCISLYHRERYGKGWDYFLQLSNTDPEVIHRAVSEITAQCFGKVPYIREDKSRGSRRICYCVVINSKAAIHRLLSVMTLTGSKKRQAGLLKEAIEQPSRRQVIVELLKTEKDPPQGNAEEILARLRSPELRND